MRWFALSLSALSIAILGPSAPGQQDGNFQPFIQTQDNPDLDLEDPLANIETEGVEVPPRLRELVQKLDAESYEARESAMNEVVVGDFDLAQLYVLLNENSLTLEQRHRLLVAAGNKLRAAPRGALGIRMQPFRRGGDPETVELEVIDVLPNLPARRVLKLNDRITEIEGVPRRGDNDLIRYAQVRTPGTPIRLTVRRVVRDSNGDAVADADGAIQYEQIEVTIELGSAEHLRTDNGQVQRGSPVQLGREQQVMWMTHRFGTKADRLEIDRAESQWHNARMAVAVRAGDDLVEQHYYIKELRRDMALIGAGADRDRFTAVWNRRLIDLQQMIDDPRTSAEDRDFLKRVQRRYLEIVAGM
jgi:hypothetical protein